MAAAEQLITANLDIWSSAIKAKSAAGRGKSNKLELYGVKKLRELILELAVRGLLVPQGPNDEPASELLKKIATEKAQLVKEGKVKKQTALPPIEEDKKPFALPKGWAWARFPDVCSYGPGKTPSTKNPVYWEDAGAGYPWVSIADMTHYETLLNTAKCVSKEAAEKVFKSEPVKAGTLLMSFKLTVGKIAKLGIDAFHNEAIISIRPYKRISEDYIYRFLPSRALAGNTKQAIMGATLNSKSLAKLLIPVPPAKEQSRIVAKVDELMALCDQLEQQQETSIAAHQTLVQTLLDALTTASERDGFTAAWARIADHFDTLFTTEWSIDQLKQTILQLAVMGKLVPQDPSDEPASELLKKIAAEKTQLLKDGKIKKPKALPPIREDEKPHELAEGWEWARIQDFSIVGTGATPSRDNSKYYSPPEFSWVTSGETSSEFLFETKECVSAKAIKETNVSIYPVGTLIVAMYGQGKTRGQITELMIEAGTNQACAAIQLVEDAGCHRGYIKLFFKKAYEELRSHAAGGAQPNLNVGKISEAVVPIPPLGSQERIVAKVDELIALCENLKANLNTAQTTQLKLADAMAEQAVAWGNMK